MQTARACLYHTTREMSDALNLDGDFFLKLKILLNDTNLLAAAIHENIRGKGTSTTAAVVVLQHVFQRTIPYKKLLEYIPASEVVDGKDSLSVSSVKISRSTVKRCFNVLVREGYLVCLTTHLEKGRVYGLNLPVIVENIRRFLAGAKIKPGTTADQQRERAVSLSQFCNQLQPWYFKVMEIGKLVLYKLDRFLELFKNWCGRNFKMLSSKIMEIAREKKEAANKKRAQKEAEREERVKNRMTYAQKKPFFTESRGKVKPNPKRALDFWGLEVKYNKDRYKGGVPIPTGKTIGQMKHWLNEQRSVHERTDEQIKDQIRDIVDHWDRIANRHFQTGEKGYHRDVPPSPDFVFYFAHRLELDPMIDMEIEAVKRFKERVKGPKTGNRLIKF